MVKTEPSQKAIERGVGRQTAVVILPDGRNLNHEIVKAGFAWWYRKYAPKGKELEALESEARTARRGLWADPRPVPPWEYRSLLRKGQYSGSVVTFIFPIPLVSSYAVIRQFDIAFQKFNNSDAGSVTRPTRL